MGVVTGDFVPTLNFINVKADAVVKAKIGTTPDMPAAAQNFLGWGPRTSPNPYATCWKATFVR